MTQPVYKEKQTNVVPGGFDAYPGVVVVQMDLPEEKSEGGIFYTEVQVEDFMADVGAVVAVGEPLQHKQWTNKDGSPFCHPMPTLGAKVLVTPKHGKSVENFYRNGQAQKGFTRFYGFVGGVSPWTHRGDVASPIAIEWWHSILMEVTEGNFNPYADRMLVQHEVETQTKGGIHLIDSLSRDKRKTIVASVLKTGPLCRDTSVGDQIVYHEGDCVPMEHLGHGMALVREAFVYGRRV